jgi:transcriptional regulator with XRE-family HTH domain
VWRMPTTTAPKPRSRRPWVPLIDGEALLLARTLRGLTLREVVAECAGRGMTLDRGNLGRAERGEKGAIGRPKLPAVAEVLGIDVTEVLAGHPNAAAFKKKAAVALADVKALAKAGASRKAAGQRNPA